MTRYSPRYVFSQMLRAGQVAWTVTKEGFGNVLDTLPEPFWMVFVEEGVSKTTQAIVHHAAVHGFPPVVEVAHEELESINRRTTGDRWAYAETDAEVLFFNDIIGGFHVVFDQLVINGTALEHTKRWTVTPLP